MPKFELSFDKSASRWIEPSEIIFPPRFEGAQFRFLAKPMSREVTTRLAAETRKESKEQQSLLALMTGSGSTDLQLAQFVELVEDWEGIEEDGKGPLKCTKQTRQAICEYFDDLALAVVRAIRNIGVKRVEEQETETEKRSKN